MKVWQDKAEFYEIDKIIVENNNFYSEARIIFEHLEKKESILDVWHVAKYLDSIGRFAVAAELRASWFAWITEKDYHNMPIRPKMLQLGMEMMANNS